MGDFQPWDFPKKNPWKGESLVGKQVVVKASRKWRGRQPVWTVIDQELHYASDTRLLFILERKTPSGIRRRTAWARDTASVVDAKSECKVTRHTDAPKARAVMWEVDHPWYGKKLAVRCPFNEELLNQIKNLIPKNERKWDGRQRLWYMGLGQGTIMRELLDRFFPDGGVVPVSITPSLLVVRSTGRGVEPLRMVGTWARRAAEVSDHLISLLQSSAVSCICASYGVVDGKPYDSDVFSPWRVKGSEPADPEVVRSQKVGPFKVFPARGGKMRLSPGLGGAANLIRKMMDSEAVWLVVDLAWDGYSLGSLSITRSEGTLPFRITLERPDWAGSGKMDDILGILGVKPSSMERVDDDPGQAA